MRHYNRYTLLVEVLMDILLHMYLIVGSLYISQERISYPVIQYRLGDPRFFPNYLLRYSQGV